MGIPLYHVTLSLECDEIAKARTPPGPDISSVQTIEAWSERARIANNQRDALIERYLKPALACLLNAEDLPKMLAQCEQSAPSHAVIKIVLETP